MYKVIKSKKCKLWGRKKVKKAIADIGGMMPEEMPTPEKPLKEVLKLRLKKEGSEVTTNCSQLKM